MAFFARCRWELEEGKLVALTIKQRNFPSRPESSALSFVAKKNNAVEKEGGRKDNEFAYAPAR